MYVFYEMETQNIGQDVNLFYGNKSINSSDGVKRASANKGRPNGFRSAGIDL